METRATLGPSALSLMPIMEQIVGFYVQELWAGGRRERVRARLFTAMNGYLLAGAGPDRVRCEGRVCQLLTSRCSPSAA